MRLAVEINGEPAYVVGVDGAGFVGVHVVGYPGKIDGPSVEVRGSAHFSPSEAETIHRTWEGLPMKLGDRVTITCTDLAPSAPKKESSTSSDRRIGIRELEHASRVAEIVRSFERDLAAMIRPIEQTVDLADGRRFRRAVGSVFAELLQSILNPLWNAHPSLQPQGWRDDRSSPDEDDGDEDGDEDGDSE